MFFRRARAQKNQSALTMDGAGLTGGTAPTTFTFTQVEGGYFLPPIGDARRSAANTNDLRGKILRIKPKSGNIAAADFNKADYGSGSGAYTIPAGNLFPLVAGAPQAKTRPEVHSMGFRNPFRVDVDSDGVIYTSDYSPDANTPSRGRGPAGVGRYEIVRKPSNYGWPTCYSSKLGYWEWEFSEFTAGSTTPGRTPLTGAKQIDCGGPTQKNTSRWVRDGGPSVEPGLQRAAAGHRPGRLVLVPGQPERDPPGGHRHAVPGLHEPDRRHAGAGLGQRVPAPVPGAVRRWRRAARHGQVRVRREQPVRGEVPAVLRRLGHPRRVRPQHHARAQARR